MADPHDPHEDEAHDAGIGFSSADSLSARPVAAPEPEAEPEPQPAVEPIVTPPDPEPVVEPTYAALDDPGLTLRSTRSRPAEPEPVVSEDRRGYDPCIAVYALTFCGVFFGLGVPLALILAHVTKWGSAPWIRTHYRFLIRTLWISVAVALVGMVTILIGIGVFILFLLAAWLVARATIGLLKLLAGRPIANPESWLF